MKYGCKHCIYYGECPRHEKCEYFSPATEDAQDDLDEKELSGLRDEFVASWGEYIRDWN